MKAEFLPGSVMVFSTKAVSDRFISAAMLCMTEAGRVSSTRHTAAGLPTNGSGANASACGQHTAQEVPTLVCVYYLLVGYKLVRSKLDAAKALCVPGTVECAQFALPP